MALVCGTFESSSLLPTAWCLACIVLNGVRVLELRHTPDEMNVLRGTSGVAKMFCGPQAQLYAAHTLTPSYYCITHVAYSLVALCLACFTPDDISLLLGIVVTRNFHMLVVREAGCICECVSQAQRVCVSQAHHCCLLGSTAS